MQFEARAPKSHFKCLFQSCRQAGSQWWLLWDCPVRGCCLTIPEQGWGSAGGGSCFRFPVPARAPFWLRHCASLVAPSLHSILCTNLHPTASPQTCPVLTGVLADYCHQPRLALVWVLLDPFNWSHCPCMSCHPPSTPSSPPSAQQHILAAPSPVLSSESCLSTLRILFTEGIHEVVLFCHVREKCTKNIQRQIKGNFFVWAGRRFVSAKLSYNKSLWVIDFTICSWQGDYVPSWQVMTWPQ